MQSEPTNADPPKRTRRWFQFSLRTLMIVVTLFCVTIGGYIGWQRAIIRDRESLAHAPEGLIRGIGWLVSRDEIPLVRRWLGDKQYSHVILYDSASDVTIERYRAAFPEAIVLRLAAAKKAPLGSPWPPIE